MKLESILEKISYLNEQLGGEVFFQKPLSTTTSDLNIYFNSIVPTDFLIGLKGNDTSFLSKAESQNIFYMFEDFLSEDDTLIATQQDSNALYVNIKKEVFGVLSGDDSYLLADTLSNFFQAILTAQNFLLECDLEKFDEDFSYKARIFSQIKDKILSQIKDPNYFIEFFYG